MTDPSPLDPAAQQAIRASTGNILPGGGGGGQINVVPADLSEAAMMAANSAVFVQNIGGILTSAAVGESGCDPAAAGAFAAMQAAWIGQTSFLLDCDNGLSAALGGAATAYPANDAAQMRVWTGP